MSDVTPPTTPSSPSGPTPGWYDDPQGSGRQRYWDGSVWTDHYQAAPSQPVAVQPAQTVPTGGLTCPQCGGHNITVQMVQTKAKTKGRSMGCLWGIMRAFLILITLGLWLLVGRRSATGKTTFTNERVAVCHTCGNTWPLGNGKKKK